MIKSGNSPFTFWDVAKQGNTFIQRSLVKIDLPYMRNGNELPNHRWLIENKQSATTALQAERRSIESYVDGKVTCIRRDSGQLYLREGFNTPPSGWDTNTVPNHLVVEAQAKARTYAHKKVRELQTPFQAGVFGGEMRETIGLLKAPLEKSIRLTKDLLKLAAQFDNTRGRFKNGTFVKAYTKKRPKGAVSRKAKNVVNAVSNSWLEYRFGILPLISDINAIIELAADQANMEQHFKNRTYWSAESSTTPVIFPNHILFNANLSARRTESVVYRAECFIRFGVVWELIEKHEAFSQRLIANVDDLDEAVITAWELIPWSFLVDYFVNVGDLITSVLTPRSLVSYSSESVVRTIIRQSSIDHIRNTGTGGTSMDNIIVYSQPHITVKQRRVDRVGGALAIPPITFTLPGSNIKYMNIAALLGTILQRS